MIQWKVDRVGTPSQLEDQLNERSRQGWTCMGLHTVPVSGEPPDWVVIWQTEVPSGVPGVERTLQVGGRKRG